MSWWARVTLRHGRGSRWFLVILAGVSVGLVAASWQAERRAVHSLDRLTAYSHAPDEGIFSCPVGIDPSKDPSLMNQCLTKATALAASADVAQMAEVESAGTGASLVIAVLDPAAANGFGRVTLLEASGSPGFLSGEPIVIDGRLPTDDAPDEVMLSEHAASAAGLRAGDTVRLAGWTSTDGRFDEPPDSPPFDSKVVGIVRYVSDLAVRDSVDLTGTLLSGSMYAGQGWTAAHADGLFSYGWAASVRIRDGDVKGFNTALSERWSDRVYDVGSVVDTNLPTLQRAVDTERQAVLAFAIIGACASAAVLALTMARHLRREAPDVPTLTALGATRSELIGAGLLRALAVAVPAALLAALVCVVLSPLGPLGIARRAEPNISLRVDATVLLVTAAALVIGMLLVAVAAAPRTGRRRAAPHGVSRIGAVIGPLGPAPQAGVTFSRGGSQRAAITVAALAIAACVASVGVVRSFDRVQNNPVRYGAWWDLVVGDYSNADALAEGIDLIRANDAVEAAATIADTDALIDGRSVRVISTTEVLGAAPSTVVAGRMAADNSEIVLGTTLADDLGVSIGDDVTVAVEETDGSTTLRVVGTAVLNDPISLDIGPGEAALVPPGTGDAMSQQVGQSILVRFDPTVDRDAAVRSVLDDFDASVVAVTPQSDLRNLQHIRIVPSLIAALIAVLALATFAHATVLLMHRHRRDLAVLAASGMTRRQLRMVALSSSVAVVTVASIIGIVLGVIAGRALWRSVADRIGVPSGPVVHAIPIALVTAVALACAVVIATIAQARASAGSMAAALRDE